MYRSLYIILIRTIVIIIDVFEKEKVFFKGIESKLQMRTVHARI
jgi:hypothetical protein